MSENDSLSSQKNLPVVPGSFLFIFIAIDRIAAFYASSDLTTGFWAAAIVAIGALLTLEIFVFKRNLSAALRFLGFGRPHGRTLTLAALIGLLTLLFFPVFSAVTGASVSVPDNWFWRLSGIVAIHGIAEEVLFQCRE